MYQSEGFTYQDVTNVGAIGLGTFRLGINVTGGEFKVGTGVTIHTAGVVTLILKRQMEPV